MPLINCPDCEKPVSSAAPSCVNCGAPIASAVETAAAGASLTTTQGTSKKLKLQTVYSAIAIVVGVSLLTATPPGETPIAGPALALGGVVWLVVTRVRIWWHHS